MNDDPVTREKLMRIRAEIEAMCEREGITAAFVLGAPNQTEAGMVVAAPWTCATLEQGPERHQVGIRVRSKAAEWTGDPDARMEIIGNTASMLDSFGMVSGHQAMAFLQTAQRLKDHTGIEVGPLEPVRPQ